MSEPAEDAITRARARLQDDDDLRATAAPLAKALDTEGSRHRERVNYVVGLMADGLFVEGETFAVLADVWGLHRDTVKRITAEASHLAQRLVDAPAVRLRCAASCGRALEALDGALKGEERVGAANAIAKVTATYAGLVGAGAAVKLEHAGPGGRPLVTLTLTTDVARLVADYETARDAGGDVASAAAALNAAVPGAVPPVGDGEDT